MEGGVTGTEGALGRIHGVHHCPIQADQGVVAHLVIVVGMGGLEGVDRR